MGIAFAACSPSVKVPEPEVTEQSRSIEGPSLGLLLTAVWCSGIQIWFHDTKWGDDPHFRDLRGTPEYEAMGGDKFYFQFGYYRIW